MGGKPVFSGSLSYVVRLTFQTFDQYHSDSQDLFRNFFISRYNWSFNLFSNKIKQFNLCVGTVIDRNWILTSATCCKRDEIVTIKFNDYSIFFPDDDEHEIISTLFHIHQDFDVCLIRTAADMSEIVDMIPCLTKVCAEVHYLKYRGTRISWALS